MLTALSEKLRKFTAVTLITTLVFSFTAPAFAASSTLTSISVGAQVGTLSAGTGSSVTYLVTVNRTGSGSMNVAMSINGSLPAGVTSSFSPAIVSFSGNTTPLTTTLTLTTTGATPAGATSFTVQGVEGSTTVTDTGTITVGAADVTPPVFTLTTLSSNNAVPTSAKSGDIVTAVFTTSETLGANPTVTFGGQAMAFGTLVGNTYTYTRTLTGTETAGSAALLVTGSDLIPNTTTDSNIGTLTTDFTTPSAPSFVSPAANSFLTTAALDKIDWTDVTDSSAPVTYVYSSSFSATTNIDGSFTAPIYTSGALSTSEIATAGTPAGVYYVSVKAVDAVGNSSPWTTPIQITVDNTAPALSLPSNITQEATGPTGNVVTYVATSTDVDPTSPTVNCTPASGSTFPITTTVVNCTATDTAGNVSNGSFTVTVQDTTAPVITLVGGAVNLTVGGAAYSEQGATVFDVVDTGLSATIDASAINPALPGSYMVTYNVTDTHGNAAITVNRVVNVSDVTGPAFFGVPADIVVEQVGTASAAVSYTAPTAVDDVDGSVAVLCGPLSGSLFSYGTTAVLCSAQDSAVAPGPNVSNTSFNVTLQDTLAPTVTSVSIVSNNVTPTLAKEGDVITVSFTTSEPVNLPTATIAGKTATVTNTGGNNYTATYTLTATETQGAATIAINFDDIAGNDADQVTAVTDASSVTIDTSVPLAPVVARPSESEVITTATSTSEGACETGTTVSISSTSLVTNPTTVTCVGGQFLTTITFTPGSLNTTFPITFTQTDTAGNTSAAVIYTVNYREPQQAGGGSALFVLLENNQTPPSNPTPTPSPEPTPTNPTNPTPTTETTPTTPETTNTTGDNSELIPTSFPNETETDTTGATGDTTTGGTTTGGGTTGGGTTTGGSTTTGGTFNPASATLDAGGGTTPEEPEVVELKPAEEIPQDIGGGVVPEEESHTLAWTLLGLVVLLNFAWFYTRKNSVPTR